MDKMISTSALYSDYLAHARVYSHKYIKREPDGKGGYRYWYPTDFNAGRSSSRHYTVYAPDNGPYSIFGRKTGIVSTSTTSPQNMDSAAFITSPSGFMSTKRMREADKAGQIYREGLSENNATNTTQKSDMAQKPNIAQQTMSSITSTAKNTISAGKQFISSIFSSPITTSYTIKDLQGNTVSSGTKKSSVTEVIKDTVSAGKKWLSNIIGTKKNVTVTDK